MKNKWIYIVIGVLILTVVSVWLRAKNLIGKIKYGLADGVKLNNISFQGAQIYLPIWFYNPTAISFVVSDLDLKIYLNDQFASRWQSPSNYVLKSKKNSTYPILINVATKDVMNILALQGSIIDEDNWLEKVQVRVVGSVKIDTGLFPIRIPINIVDSLKYYVG